MSNITVRLSVLFLLGAVILLIPAGGPRALGLGEARVDSYLGQPLDVSVRLLEVESEIIESISVGPASVSDFERLGIPSEALALDLDVSIDRRADPPRVRVRSGRPVNDPVVQILVDARWSSGRVLREYTLFLDPPTTDAAPPARPATATPAEPAEQRQPTRRPAPERTAEPAPSSRPRPESESPTRQQPAARGVGGESVAVAPGDTLWRIARNWRPDDSLSMDQVMLAIFNRNQRAFIDNNINRLRSDVTLTMPELDEVRGLGQMEAERRIREHMQAWQQEAIDEVPVVSDAGIRDSEAVAETADPVEPAPAETPEGQAESDSEAVHRLDVVPPEEDEFADGSAVSEEEVREVRSALGEVEDEILAEGLEREEFDEHISEIRDALDSRDMAGLAFAEESLAELEARLREVREARASAAASDADEAPADEVEGYLEELERELAAEDGLTEEEAAGTEEADEADAATAPEDAAADSAEPAESGMTVTRTEDSGMAMWMWVAAGALVLILLAAVVWVWRRRASETGTGTQATAGDPEAEARDAVAANPDKLAAHLALLRILADRDDTRAFSNAFDDMYRHVGDDADRNWQEALSLAATHAPNHPLLTPKETPADETDDFDRRTEEMLGLLGGESEDADSASQEKAAGESFLEEDLDMGADEDESEAKPPEDAGVTEDDDQDDALSDDMDLAVLSERLDDPSLEPGQDQSFGQEAEEPDFDTLSEAGEGEADADAAPDEADTVSGSDDLDLDFEFSSQAGPDTESADEPEDFDLEDAELPGEDEPIEETDQPAPRDTQAGGQPAGGSAALNDEDADVKLDLARAYMSVDLGDSARNILEEVLSDGSPEKQDEARKLLDDL